MGDGIPTSYKTTYRPPKRSTLGCLELPFSDYPLTQCHKTEEWNHHVRGLRKPFKLTLHPRISAAANAGRGKLKDMPLVCAPVVKHSHQDI